MLINISSSSARFDISPSIAVPSKDFESGKVQEVMLGTASITLCTTVRFFPDGCGCPQSIFVFFIFSSAFLAVAYLQ
jgi:hypothetical protein